MLRSMTGFGQAGGTVESYNFQIEIKSVNHRYQETVVRLPREWLQLEDTVKKLVQSTIYRGRVDVFITLQRDMVAAVEVEMNWPLAEGYYAASAQVAERFGLPHGLTAKDVLLLPDIIHFREVESASDEWMSEQLVRFTNDALQQLLEMRQTEGRHMQARITQCLQLLEQQWHDMMSFVPQAHKEYSTKLRERIAALLADTAVDESRLLTEVAIMAERANIDEELTRLDSHFKQCWQLLETQGPAGRKLDFLIQEMNREINTIGSKSNDANMARLVVDMKAELEKIREQVQNVE